MNGVELKRGNGLVFRARLALSAAIVILSWLLVACAPEPLRLPHLSVVGPWSGGEREAFMKVIDAFSAKTSVPVSYESIRNEMGAALRTRIAAGGAPDIALMPRPGEVAELARAGNLVDLSRYVSDAELAQSFGPSYIELGQVDGKQVGILFKANSKSIVWFRPTSLEQLGAPVPRTLDDLFTVAERYKAAGKVPFSVGGKDAWVLTDYQENLLARLVDSATYYDLYLTHKVSWTSPQVKQSLVLFTRFFQPGYQLGGITDVVQTSLEDSIGQVFGAYPTAEMIFEGGFVGVIALSDVNRNLQPGKDIDFFPFPRVDDRFGDPIVGGGDTAVVFRDSPESREFVRFLISPDAANLLAASNTISPNRQLDPTRFPSPLARKEYEQLVSGSRFVFDGSDLAPSALGGDFLFTELLKLIQNPNDVDRIAQELEDFAQGAYKK